MNISEQGKRRLRIAARFLRGTGHRFKDGNFYDSVLDAIQQLSEEKREELRSLVDWVEEYELAERDYWDDMGAPAPTKQNTSLQRKNMRLPARTTDDKDL